MKLRGLRELIKLMVCILPFLILSSVAQAIVPISYLDRTTINPTTGRPDYVRAADTTFNNLTVEGSLSVSKSLTGSDLFIVNVMTARQDSGRVGIGTSTPDSATLDVIQADNTGLVGTGADGYAYVNTSVNINTDSIIDRENADAVNFSITSTLAEASTTITLESAPDGLAVGDEIIIINLRDTKNVQKSLYGWMYESTATSGDVDTLVDTAQSWTVNELVDLSVSIVAGSGIGWQSSITSNDATTIELTNALLNDVVDNTTEYKIFDLDAWATNIAAIDVGQHETHLITGIAGNVLTIDFGLTNEYDGTTHSIMVQRIPNYGSVYVQDGGTLTVNQFDEDLSTGGVLFVRACNQILVADGGFISVEGKGYIGSQDPSQGAITYNGVGGIAASAVAVGELGYGGGGASNSSPGGTVGGAGAGVEGSAGSAGAGGYGTVGGLGGGAIYINGQGPTSGNKTLGGRGCRGTGTHSGGAGGGYYGDASLTHLMFGSGGGHGRYNNTNDGGDGGGIVVLSAPKIEILGSVTADGENADVSTESSGGAGGAAGSMLLASRDLSLGNGLVVAEGGAGSGKYQGGGGDGGYGRIVLSYNNLSGSPTPAAGSTSTFTTSEQTNAILINNLAGGDIMNLQGASEEKYVVRNDGGVESTASNISGASFLYRATNVTTGSIFDMDGDALTTGKLLDGSFPVMSDGDFIYGIGTLSKGNVLRVQTTGTNRTEGTVINANMNCADEGRFVGKYHDYKNYTATISEMRNHGRISLSGEQYNDDIQVKATGFNLDIDGQLTMSDYTHTHYGRGTDGDITLATDDDYDIDSDIIAAGRAYADAINYSVPTYVKFKATTIDLEAAPDGIMANDEILIITLRDPNNYDHKAYGLIDDGIAESGSLTTLTDTDKAWCINEFAGMYILITGGTGNPSQLLIASNTSDTITVTDDFNDTIDTTSTYSIVDSEGWANNLKNIHVGQYETRIVTDVTGNILTLDRALEHEYDGVNYTVMVQRIPQYGDVTISHNATLSTSTFSSATGKGGVLVFRAENVEVQRVGWITANGDGYAGGEENRGGVSYNGTGGDADSANNTVLDSTKQGGGGGIDRYSNASTGTIGGGGGCGNPYGQGGGGGHITGGQRGNGLNQGYGAKDPTGIIGGSGGYYVGTHAAGGGGGKYGDPRLTILTMGSGGGGNEDGELGGNGAGIIGIFAKDLTCNGYINSNGMTGYGIYSERDPTGSGAGGSVLIVSDSVTMQTDTVSAKGGLGSPSNYSRSLTAIGGDGIVAIYSSNITGTASPETRDIIKPTILIDLTKSGDVIVIRNEGSTIFSLDTEGQTSPLSIDGSLTVKDSLMVDGDTLYVDHDTDRVGIGTINPTVTLEIVGDLSASSDVTISRDLYVARDAFISDSLSIEKDLTVTQNVLISRDLSINGNTTVGGDLDVFGCFNTTLPHGIFFSEVTQSIANVLQTQSIKFDANDDVHKLIHDTVFNTSKIYVIEDGSYEAIFSGISDLVQVPGDKHLEVWGAINGVNMPNSNTRTQIQNAAEEDIVAVSLIFDLEKGDYFEFMTWGDDVDCQWLYTAAAAGPERPAVPSVIVSFKKISGYPKGD